MFPFSIFKRKKKFATPTYSTSSSSLRQNTQVLKGTNLSYSERYYPVQYDHSCEDNGSNMTVVDSVITAEVLMDIASSSTYDTGSYTSNNTDSFSGGGGSSDGGGASGSWDSGSSSYDNGSSSSDW